MLPEGHFLLGCLNSIILLPTKIFRPWKRFKLSEDWVFRGWRNQSWHCRECCPSVSCLWLAWLSQHCKFLGCISMNISPSILARFEEKGLGCVEFWATCNILSVLCHVYGITQNSKIPSECGTWYIYHCFIRNLFNYIIHPQIIHFQSSLHPANTIIRRDGQRLFRWISAIDSAISLIIAWNMALSLSQLNLPSQCGQSLNLMCLGFTKLETLSPARGVPLTYF